MMTTLMDAFQTLIQSFVSHLRPLMKQICAKGSFSAHLTYDPFLTM